MPETPTSQDPSHHIPPHLQPLMERLERNLNLWTQLSEKLPEVIYAVEHLERRVDEAMQRLQQGMEQHQQQLARLNREAVRPAVPETRPEPSGPAAPSAVDLRRLRQEVQDEMALELRQQLDREVQALTRNTLQPLQTQMQHLRIAVDQIAQTANVPVQPIVQGPSLAHIESQIQAQQAEFGLLQQHIESLQQSQQQVEENHRTSHQLLADHLQSLQGGLQGLQTHLVEVEKSSRDSIQQVMHAQAHDRETWNQGLQQLEQAFTEFQNWYQGAKPLARLFARPK